MTLKIQLQVKVKNLQLLINYKRHTKKYLQRSHKTAVFLSLQ